MQTTAIATAIQRTTVPSGKLAVLLRTEVRGENVEGTDGGVRRPGVCPDSLQCGSQRGPAKWVVPVIPAAATTRTANSTLPVRARCDLIRASI